MNVLAAVQHHGYAATAAILLLSACGLPLPISIVLLTAGAAVLRRHRSRRVESAPAVVMPSHRGGWKATVALLMLMGVIDATGFIGFAFGMAVAPAWLLGLVSQSGRLVAAFVATAVFRENLRPIQWLGIGLVGSGLVLAVWP